MTYAKYNNMNVNKQLSTKYEEADMFICDIKMVMSRIRSKFFHSSMSSTVKIQTDKQQCYHFETARPCSTNNMEGYNSKLKNML